MRFDTFLQSNSDGLVLAQAGPRQAIWLYNCRLLDGNGTPAQPESSLLIRGERISQVGPGRPAAAQPDEKVLALDMQGRTVLPGLVDMHVHLRANHLPHYLAAGVTTVRECGNSFVALERLEQAIANDEMPGPRLFYSGPMLDGQELSWPGFICESIVDLAEAQKKVAVLNPARRDFIKLYTNLGHAEAEYLIKAGQAQGLWVAAHPGQANLATLVEAGINTLEHLFSFSPLVGPAYFSQAGPRGDVGDFFRRVAWTWQDLGRGKLNGSELWRYFELLQKRQTYLTPTLAFLYMCAKQAQQPETEPPTHNRTLAKFLRRRTYTEHWEQADYDAALAGVKVMAQTVAEFYRQGGRVLLGSDTPNAGLPAGVGLQYELKLLLEAGLRVEEVIHLATAQAAEILQATPRPDRPRRFGKLESGYLADLIVLDQDPIQVIENCFSPLAVMKGGRMYSPAGLRKAAQAGFNW